VNLKIETAACALHTRHVNRVPILFLEKVFLKPHAGLVRGVEVFNLNLLRDLARRGFPVTVPVDPSWQSAIGARTGDAAAPPDVLPCRLGRGSLVQGIEAAGRLRGRHFRAALLGNVANGLIPALHLLRRGATVGTWILLAHREPSPRFVRACRAAGMTVVAVNRKIAAHFDGGAFPRVDVWYGVSDADAYHPPAGPRTGDGTVRFCVLGQLDNAWKGADTAVAAYRRLPPPVRERAELHLAAFQRVPEYPEPGIRPYPWMPVEQVPDFLRSMDVLLVPSRDEGVMRETFSQAIVQGMLTGLPVCAADLPVLTEKLDAGGGLVFRTADELAAHMAMLAADPGKRRALGRRGRDTALRRYVWNTDTFVQRYLL